MFASDRDLLVLEPGVFRDIVWPGQTLLESDLGSVPISGVTLSVTKGEFVSQGVSAGHVVVIDGVAVEVVEVLGETQLLVSLIRSRRDGAVVPLPFNGSGLSVRLTTFRQQVEFVHRDLMGSLGIAPEGESVGGSIGESAVMNGGSFVLAEALGTLAGIYASASALVDEESVTWVKARMYRERFETERSRLVAEIDLDGDGVAEAARRMNSGTLRRA